jgi:hypothetical protein
MSRSQTTSRADDPSADRRSRWTAPEQEHGTGVSIVMMLTLREGGQQGGT